VDLAAEKAVHRASAAALATSDDNTVIACNAAALKLIGRTSGEVLGRNLQEVIAAKDVYGNLLDGRYSPYHEMARRFDALQSFKMDIRTGEEGSLRVGVSIIVVVGAHEGEQCFVYLLTPIHRRRRADQLIDRILGGAAPGASAGYTGEESRGAIQDVRITDRQREVLRLLAEGRTAAEISKILGVSVHTVRTHVRRVLDVLAVKNQIEAVAKALALRLI
jgi:DNA-binding CsgD family transcriptional regulator